MRCDEVERLLDEGGPVTEAARAHARECPRCAASVRTAASLESMLREPPPAPGALFTERVMARVLTEARAPAHALEARGRVGWLAALAQEPFAAVALALAPVALLLAIVWPETLANLVEMARSAVSVWLAGTASGLGRAMPGDLGAMGPTAQWAVGVTLAAALAAAAYAAPLWIAERIAGTAGRRRR